MYPPNDPQTEMLDRMRRIETRLTKYMKAQGFDTHPARPVFDRGDVTIPSRDCTLREIMSVVPEDWDGEVFVWWARTTLPRYRLNRH